MYRIAGRYGTGLADPADRGSFCLLTIKGMYWKPHPLSRISTSVTAIDVLVGRKDFSYQDTLAPLDGTSGQALSAVAEFRL